MSAVEDPAEGDQTLAAYPRFALCCLFDDRDDPRELTVFPARPDAGLTTEWITIDADHAMPLDAVR